MSARTFSAVILISMQAGAASAEQGKMAISDFEFLIGKWEARSIFYSPRNLERKPVETSFEMECSYALKNTYIECDNKSIWPGMDEPITFRSYFNYSRKENGLQALFLYDRRSIQVSYILRASDTDDVLTGFTDFSTSDGRSGQERIEWRISKDRRSIDWREYQHFDTEQADYWPLGFSSVMQKLPLPD